MKAPETHQERYYAVWAAVGEVVLAILTSAAAKLIGKRLGYIAEGSWLPGMGDIRIIAGLTNCSPRTLESNLTKCPRKKYRTGRAALYRLNDFAIPVKKGGNE